MGYLLTAQRNAYKVGIVNLEKHTPN